MNKVPYFKTETFGAVDGPGTRLIIFLQGCPLRCVYCHNPESWDLNGSDTKISVDEIIKLYRNFKLCAKEDEYATKWCYEKIKTMDNRFMCLFFDACCRYNWRWCRRTTIRNTKPPPVSSIS